MKPFIPFLIVITSSSFISATSASENLLNCPKESQYPWIWGNCALTIKPLTPQPKDNNIPFHADFSLTYSFDCQGSETDFGIASGSSFKKFNMGAINAELTGLSGDQALQTYDPNPALTKKLGFRPGCKLEIHQADYTPSFQTLNLWNTEAYSQSKVIRYAIAAYELSRDFENYRAWDIAKTQQMITSLDGKIQLFERRCELDASFCITLAHFKILRNALQAKLDQTPNLPTPDQIQQDIESVATYYRESLEKEVRIAEEMIARYKRWEAPINQALVDALALIP